MPRAMIKALFWTKTLDAYSLPYTIRVAQAKSGRPKSRLSKMPRLYAATFAATRIRRPQPVWASGYLSPKLSLKLAKVVSTTWRAALHQRRWAPDAAVDSGQTWAACAVAPWVGASPGPVGRIPSAPQHGY